ncbi:hypothetical protein BASA60_006970 [Batrachochytrium salamandrivorans]|nr:hypothetical protein BASA60_006970 [Batrachochytrium salamandrivorans]
MVTTPLRRGQERVELRVCKRKKTCEGGAAVAAAAAAAADIAAVDIVAAVAVAEAEAEQLFVNHPIN